MNAISLCIFENLYCQKNETGILSIILIKMKIYYYVKAKVNNIAIICILKKKNC